MALVNKTVIIVGAGVAGIAAATKLLKNNVQDFIILEAENRLGGRIQTIPFGDGHIDIGAQWIHGEEGNVVYQMASEKHLVSDFRDTMEDFMNSVFVTSTGQIIPIDLSSDFIKSSYSILDESPEDDLERFMSIGELFQKRLEKMTIKNKELPIKQMVNWCHHYQNSYNGSDSLYEASSINIDTFKHCPGYPAISWKSKGYSTIIDLLLEKYNDQSENLQIKDKLIYGKEIVKIYWSGDRAEIICADNSHFQADYVILTVSLGVLKNVYNELFEPELPEYKLKAIKNLGIGTVDKLFLKFPYKWWSDNISGFSFLWSDADRELFINENKSRGWDYLCDVFGFYKCNNCPNTLLGWIVGSAARKMERKSIDEIKIGLMYLLNKFLADKFIIPFPDLVTRSQWGTNSHFYGSYSFHSMNTDKEGKANNELAKPLVNSKKKEIICFAGEATHSHYFSTVHGAIETGWREADRILIHLKNTGI
ncbi:spermine oxidase-like [Daktulosphaira vitifoliae]|uniref:spermine oxidase-like n=1 Tax=Daktulosphaira vitifoliae TaxID=58002 RepID=UPI0021AA2F95|nr:spermine oxidase-like [Daktulosphaira vitifoliae]XP_050545416.1 spermine oxidase-like [Daktulosphaira vitifoliae]XP_050545417.1 spermine oxidase-like [Daktulosphaira vitifoliae]XP_050545418.1 spermine oxidase-like [Daktulosphaira vitifoliae]XP_050545419.1 spermine oxidase-like [Daktulosphaira vitifoliae]